MMNKLYKRYVSEGDVKKALKIDSFRNMTKDKIMEFASMIPYMDKEVAISIINQFPVFADFGKTAISRYTQICDDILENNKESQKTVIYSYQKILDTLSRRMDKEEDWREITEEMIMIADKIAELDLNNKKFLDRMSTKALFGVLGVAALVGAAIGVNSKFGGGSELPQLADYDNDTENMG